MAFEKNYTAFASSVFGGPSGRVFIDVLAQDLSGATFAWAFSLSEGAAATFTLTNAAASDQGISATYDANMIHPVSGLVVGGTRIVPRINEATLEALDFGGAAQRALIHNLYETPVGGTKRVRCFGILMVKKGAPN
jgi:hypothetical protein